MSGISSPDGAAAEGLTVCTQQPAMTSQNSGIDWFKSRMSEGWQHLRHSQQTSPTSVLAFTLIHTVRCVCVCLTPQAAFSFCQIRSVTLPLLLCFSPASSSFSNVFSTHCILLFLRFHGDTWHGQDWGFSWRNYGTLIIVCIFTTLHHFYSVLEYIQ